jgi:predicted permease
MIRRFWLRLRNHFRNKKFERELEAEMRFHLEMETEKNIGNGMSEEEARLVARRSFGGVAQVKEEYRDLTRFRLVEELWHDVRFGARLLLKQPGFLAVAVLTLALGIGASTAIFSVVNGVLIRSLPYRDPSQLVWIGPAAIDLANPHSDQSAWGWRDWVQSFEHVAAFGADNSGINLEGAGGAERIEARDVSANFFQTLGVSPVAGRFFGPEQERQENLGVAVISSRLWQRRFSGELDVIGKTLQLNGKSFTIIGVAPPELQYPAKLDAWIPISFDRFDLLNPVFTRSSAEHTIFARIKSGVTLAEARAEMKAVAERTKLGEPISVTPIFEELTGGIRRTLILLMAAVGLVLLMACANVVNLLLARSATRRKELAVRAALGAGRGRLIRQSLTESLLIGLLGGLAGLMLAAWLYKLLLAFSPSEIPRLDEITLDYRVLAFNAALTVLAGLLVGLLPAIQGSKGDLIEPLKADVQKFSAGAGTLSLKSALIIGEIALSLILLIGAGLLLRSLTKVLSVDAGFERENVLTVSLALPHRRYSVFSKEQTKVQEFYRRLIEQVRAIPGVKAVGATSKIPLSREYTWGSIFEVEGKPKSLEFDESFAWIHWVSADYFKAMGIPLLHGRPFAEADHSQVTTVMIINETMARRVFPDGNALGKGVNTDVDFPQVPREVIGVVGAVRSFGLEEEPRYDIFLPYLQGGMPPTTLAIRTVGDPMTATAAVREVIRRLDENLPPYDIKTLEQRISDSVARRRFLVSLMGIFAILGLALAATGIYGVLSYLVAQRTREIGIRMALGATAGDVLRLILKQASLLILAGTAFGLAGAMAATRLIKTLLYGVSATDASIFIGAAVLLMLTALLATYIPGRKATKVDPLVAFRHE